MATVLGDMYTSRVYVIISPFLPVSQDKQLSMRFHFLYAYTGCDYNPAFYRKGKINPFKKLYKSTRFIAAFSQLGRDSFLTESLMFEVEAFTC